MNPEIRFGTIEWKRSIKILAGRFRHAVAAPMRSGLTWLQLPVSLFFTSIILLVVFEFEALWKTQTRVIDCVIEKQNGPGGTLKAHHRVNENRQ